MFLSKNLSLLLLPCLLAACGPIAAGVILGLDDDDDDDNRAPTLLIDEVGQADQILTNSGALDGRIVVTFTLTDPEGDPTDVTFTAGLSGGGTQAPASVLRVFQRDLSRADENAARAAGQNPGQLGRFLEIGNPDLRALASSAGGTVYRLVWDTTADGFSGGGLIDLELTLSAGTGNTQRQIVRLGARTALFTSETAPVGSGIRVTGAAGDPLISAFAELADLNGDGRLDLLFSTSRDSDQDVRHLYGIAATTSFRDLPFAELSGPGLQGPLSGTANITSTQGQATDFACADFDGDGLLDLAVPKGFGGAIPDSVSVRLSGAIGNNISPPGFEFGVGLSPLSLASADLNGDGFPDLVSANFFSRDLSVLLNRGDGSGTFLAESRLSTGSRGPVVAVIGDVDGDGDADILAGLEDQEPPNDQDGIAVFLNSGNGNFSTSPIISVDDIPGASEGVNSNLALGDVDQDGRVDLVHGAQGRIQVRLGRAGAIFDQVDATLDTGALSLSRLRLADLNADGLLDIVVLELALADAEFSYVLNLGGGRFSRTFSVPLSLAPVDLAVGDLNGDGYQDIVVVSTSEAVPLAQIDVHLNRGPPGLQSWLEVPGGNGPEPGDVGDIDNDGVVDLAFQPALPPGTPELLLRQGLPGDPDAYSETQLRRYPTTSAGTSGGQVELADLDGDGLLDSVITDDEFTNLANDPLSALQVRLWREDTAGLGDELAAGGGVDGWLPAVPLPLPQRRRLHGIVVADLNADGNRDLLVASELASTAAIGSISVWLGTGSGGFGSPTEVTTSAPARGLAVGDANEDGLLDLVVALDPGGFTTLAFFPGSGNGNFGAETILVNTPAITPPKGPLTLRDLDGDGHLDLITGSVLQVFRGLGDGAFLSTATLESPLPLDLPDLPTSFDHVIGDLDADGRLDLISAGGTERDSVAVLSDHGRNTDRGGGRPRGDGQIPYFQGFRTLENHTLTTDVSTVRLGDLTGNGSPDVVGFPRNRGLQLLQSVARQASREEAALAVIFTDVVTQVRSDLVAPLDLSLITPSPTNASTLLRQASLAVAYRPESAQLPAGTADATITIPLHASLTQDELQNGVLRVFRQNRDPSLIHPSSGERAIGPLVEVARRGGGGGVATATVDATLGTISFPVRQLGRFQVFLERPRSQVVLYRETFDQAGVDSLGRAPLPPDWRADWLLWESGSPTASNRPAPISAPNLLGLGMRRNYPDSVAGAFVTSSDFPLAAAQLPARTLTLRLLEFHDLAAGDRVEVSLVSTTPTTPTAGAPVHTLLARRIVRTYTATSPSINLTLDTVDIGPALQNLLAIDLGGAPLALVRLEFRLISDGATNGRGFFLDDLEVVLE